MLQESGTEGSGIVGPHLSEAVAAGAFAVFVPAWAFERVAKEAEEIARAIGIVERMKPISLFKSLNWLQDRWPVVAMEYSTRFKMHFEMDSWIDIEISHYYSLRASHVLR